MYVLAIDQGTSSTRAGVVDAQGKVLGWGSRGHSQIYPRPSWVEHDPMEIWANVKAAIKEAVANSGVEPSQLACIGVTNQRETVVVWDPSDGRPLYNAIVWQDKRTFKIVEELAREAPEIRERTGLAPDSYFTGPKIRWLLENVGGLRQRVREGRAIFGTVDSWIAWNLTRGGKDVVNARGGGAHVTDYSNASRTMLFDIRKLSWEPDLLELMGGIDDSSLPLPLPSGYRDFGFTGPEVSELIGARVPVTGIIGDQQAALFGQAGFDRGMVKATYGTGTFALMNTGTDALPSRHGLLTTVFYSRERGSASYALEGSALASGAALRWAIDVGIARDENELEKMASAVNGNGGVYFVPALAGLGAPYWDQYARGLIIGLTRASDARYLARAVLESVAYMASDIVGALRLDSGVEFKEVRVDGGSSRSDFLMQFQADVMGTEVVRPLNAETTTLGAAYLAGLEAGMWGDLKEISSLWKPEMVFRPSMGVEERERLYGAWRKAVSRAMGWAKEVPWTLAEREG